MSANNQNIAITNTGIGELKIVNKDRGAIPTKAEPANDRTSSTESFAVAAPSSALDAAPPPTGTVKGGKGGEEGQPALPPSNAAFLTAVVRDVPAGSSAAVCSKPGDPNDGGWDAEAAEYIDRQCPPDRNNYFNCSTFTIVEGEELLARKEQFSAFHTIVLDDVGTKVDRAKLDNIESTWEIETSPGNSQIGFRLTNPIADLAIVKSLQDAVMAAELCDKGLTGAARWVRLPNAINGKTKYRKDGLPFACRLVRFEPGISYSVEGLAIALGLDMNSSRPSSAGFVAPLSRSTSSGGDSVYTPAPSENPVITALRERGLLKRSIALGKHDITCPWVDEHTDEIDGGTAYFEPDADRPTGGFKCQHSHGDRYHIGQLIDFLGLKPDQARGKARIVIVAGEMNRVKRAAERALSVRGSYYQAGGAIVIIRTDPATGDISTELMSEASLASALSEAADWYRTDGTTQKQVRCDPPPRYVQALLKAQQFEFLPPLTGLARQPFFRAGTSGLIVTPGYDSVTGRYAAFDATKFQLPTPTKEAAEMALAELKGLLAEFRFASDGDRSAALSAMLAGSVRSGLTVAPAYNITASTYGSGKSYLGAVISPFAGPGVPLKVSYPTTADEASKMLLSTFLAAPAVVMFDDMQGQWLAFGAMNRALTSDTITDRQLGVSRTVTASTRSLVIGTGINIGPVRDMTRRLVTIKLHHRVATPALEQYAGKPAEAIAASRERYVGLALTIIAAWIAAGSPKEAVPNIASYGERSDACRQPLLWLGEPDPASSLIDQLEHDPDQDVLGNFLRAWHAAVGDQPIMLRDLMLKADQDADLESALEDLPVMDTHYVNRSRLGQYLRRNANRIVDGFELQDAYCSTRKAWRVVAIAEADAPTS